MDFEAVKQFLEEQKDNEEVKSYLQGFSQVTPDGVSSFLDSDEGKKLLQPKLDSYFTKGLETWKSNNLQKLVDEKLKEINPEANPLELKVKELEKQILLKDLKEKAFKAASTDKLPVQLVDFFIGENEDSTLNNLKTFKEVFDTHLNERVQEQLKSGGIDPKLNDNPPTSLTAEQLRGMSATEIAKLDQKLVNEALKNN